MSDDGWLANFLPLWRSPTIWYWHRTCVTTFCCFLSSSCLSTNASRVGLSCTAALSRNCVSSLALLARDCAEERLQTCHGSERILSYLMNPVIQSLTATSADKPTCCLPFLKFHLPGTLRRSVNTIVRSVTQNKTQSNLKCRRDMWPQSGTAGPQCTYYIRGRRWHYNLTIW